MLFLKPRRNSSVFIALSLGAAMSGCLGRSALAQTPLSINSTSQGRAAGPYSPVAQQPFINDASHRLVVSNDLGMHCAGFDTRISSILPPYNVVHAQVLQLGAKPVLLDDKTVAVGYSAAANPNDPAMNNPPILAADGSVYKTNFWDNVAASYAPFYPPGVLAQFFPASPHFVDLGLPVPDVALLYLNKGPLTLNQQTMPSVTQLLIDPVTHVPHSETTAPYVANDPQFFRVFERSYPVFVNFVFGYVANKTNWFSAEGIPLTSFDDMGRENPFPLMRVQAEDKATGKTLASLDTVVPVSGETNCKTCHLPSPYGNGLATGHGVAQVRIPPNDPRYSHVPAWVSQEWAADVNMLQLHDSMHGTTLYAGYNATTGRSPRPVVCQSCHYSPALDLAQLGPRASGGLTQTTHRTMSRVMHYGHGSLVVNGAPLFPNMPPPNDPNRTTGRVGGGINAFTQGLLNATCYQCHPGQRTKCLRGAMFSQAGAVCQDCHGQMTQVGNDFSRNVPAGGFILAADYYTNPKTPRVPWLDEPTCGSCHTGDAVSNMTATPGVIKASDNIRLLQAYLSGDAKATPIVPTNARFAEPKVTTGAAAGNPQLFRLSVDTHGGVFCEGCHGATHAEWPIHNAAANDNVTATRLQGHAGKITECGTCHTSLPNATLAGPHGIHPIGNNGFSANWVNAHGDYADSAGTANCKACHGVNGQGTPLSKAVATRANLRCETSSTSCVGGTITITAGTQVTCTSCHKNYINGGG